MEIIKVEQRTPQWLEGRRTLITGTRAKAIRPLKRKGKTGTEPVELWKLAAEYVSTGADDEEPMARGTNLEHANVEMAVAKLGLENPLYDCGMWRSEDGKLGFSPDGCENVPQPTWGIEAKSLATSRHLYLVLADMFAKGEVPDAFEPLFPARVGEYRGIDSVAEEHQDQVRQAFVVNPNLKVMYYSLYDPRVALDEFQHYIITVRREEMAEELQEQADTMSKQADLARVIALFMANYEKGGKK